MNSSILFLLFVIMLFVFIIINNLYEKKSTYIVLTISIVIGIIFYSYGYFYISDKDISSMGISALKTIFAIFGMVAGKNSLSDISSVPLYNNRLVLLIFYLIHLFIYTIVITTLLVSFGKHLILTVNNYLRLLFCKKNIYIFYKLNPKTKNIIKNFDFKKNQIVLLEDNFLNNKKDDFSEYVIKKKSIVLDEGLDNNKYLESLLLKEKYNNIRIYALNENVDDNYKFAVKLCDYLETKNNKNNIKLTIFIDEKYDISNMQNKKAFDYIRKFDEKEITSRVLVKNYPPSRYIEFENFKAKQNQTFNCLVFGLSSLSENIIKKLYIYGLFANTDFNLKIIDKNYKNISGSFNHDFEFLNDDRLYLSNRTNFSAGEYDANSDEFYEYFAENKDSINYVVVATGNEKTNEDIVKHMLKLRKEYKLKYDIFDCVNERIFAYEYSNINVRSEYNSIDYIIDDRIDTAGKWINYIFNKNTVDFNPLEISSEIDELWKQCAAYEKDSCISTADYCESILKAAGLNIDNFNDLNFDSDDLQKIEDEFNKDQMKNYENITAIDHDRWSAFVMLEQGYRYMDDEHWDMRAKNYNEIIKTNPKYKIQNDIENKLHAYLRSMEDLQKLYVKEREATNGDPTKRWNNINNFSMALLIAKNISKI